MAAPLREQLLTYLGEHNVVTLCTHGPDGLWAAPVFYAHDGFDLYFVSDPNSRHGQNLAADAAVAGAITEDHKEWLEIRGIQCEGTCTLVPEAEVAQARTVYLAKYPFAAIFLDPEGYMFEQAGQKVRFYRLRARRLCFTDNTAGFGERAEYVP